MNWGKTQLAYLGEKGPKRFIEVHQKSHNSRILVFKPFTSFSKSEIKESIQPHIQSKALGKVDPSKVKVRMVGMSHV